jgi:hypothetical protein
MYKMIHINGLRIAGTLLAAAVSLILVAGILGCNDPSEPERSDCEKHGTGTLTITNRSRSTVYYVLVDGVRTATLGPDDSTSRTVTAGSHRVEFRYAADNTRACNIAYPSVPQCSNYGISCACER